MTSVTPPILNTQTDQITVTKAAAEAIQGLLAERDLEGYALRLYIAGSSCSGYQYSMALDKDISETDARFSHHGVEVIVDPVTLEYVRGSTIDYVEDPFRGSGFNIENPNETSSCGCGNSHAHEEEHSCGCGAQ